MNDLLLDTLYFSTSKEANIGGPLASKSYLVIN